MRKIKIGHPGRAPGLVTATFSEGVMAGGAFVQDAVKCMIHLSDINEFDWYNKVYAQYFSRITPAGTMALYRKSAILN